jgi:hypothetical protein
MRACRQLAGPCRVRDWHGGFAGGPAHLTPTLSAPVGAERDDRGPIGASVRPGCYAAADNSSTGCTCLRSSSR